MRTAQQQENLVQLSQQDIQMLLAQNLLQDNQLPSTEYLSWENFLFSLSTVKKKGGGEKPVFH